MKLFLYSLGFSEEQGAALARLVGKDPHDVSMALIENAADMDTDGPPGWIEGVRQTVIDKGFQTELVDLRDFVGKRKELAQALEGKDVIWLGGGNTFYLRALLKETGADVLITDLVKKGTVYAGWSAGAVVAGPTLKFAETMDDPKVASEAIYDGLGLVDFVTVPHADNEFFAEKIKEWNTNLERAGYKTVVLTDAQALIVRDDSTQLV